MDIRKVFFISKLTLAVVLVVLVVKTVMIPRRVESVFVPSPAAGNDIVKAVEELKSTEPSVDNYSAVVKRNIFGDSNLSPSHDEPLPGDNVDKTMPFAEQELGLALVGIVYGNPEVSRAIIKNLKSDILKVYRIGEAVGDASVEKIENDTVILLQNGQRKTLTLTAAGKGEENFTREAPSIGENMGQQDEDTEPDLTDNNVVTQISEQAVQFESMLKNAVMEPYVVNGQVGGLKITGMKEIDTTRDIGLKNGDIICSVNGQRLTSKQKAYQIFKKLRLQTAVDMELLRNGQSEKLSFTLR